jgi:hypothetical protein
LVSNVPAVGDYARRPAGAARDTAANSSGYGIAISAGFQALLTVFRVRRDLLAVIIGAAAALAFELAAHQLPRLILRRLEVLLTVAASPFDHTGGCRILRSVIGQAVDLD